jgi:hypothetical protein
MNTPEKRIEKLMKALQFYADISKYPAPYTGGNGALFFDCGQVAADAIKNENEFFESIVENTDDAFLHSITKVAVSIIETMPKCDTIILKDERSAMIQCLNTLICMLERLSSPLISFEEQESL